MFQSREQFHEGVVKFVNKTIGMPYNLNLVTNGQGYFCSELIATIYKNMDLLPINKAGFQYWPGSFSTENLPEPDKY